MNDSKTCPNQFHVFDKIHSKAVRNAIWFNKETDIASISFDSTCAISDLAGKEANRLSFKDIPTAICEHPVDSNIVLIGAKNEVFAWDTRTNKTSKNYKSLMGQVIKNWMSNYRFWDCLKCIQMICKRYKISYF